MHTPDEEEHVLCDIENNPGTSSRQVARQYGVSQRAVICILHDNRYYPYHLKRVQVLSPADFHMKDSVAGLCDRPSPLWDFCLRSSSPMERPFGRDGIINLHNRHMWAIDNPHGMVEASHQQRFSINVWAGFIDDSLLEPVLLPQRLNGETYLAFLQNTLPPLLENVPLAIRQFNYSTMEHQPTFALMFAQTSTSSPDVG